MIGATTCAQPETVLQAADVELPGEGLAAVAEAYRAHPLPC
ncbi:MAG: hypothetical protein N2422_08885 [Rhodobacteraceae bacterium]|nr:hypothetical protein [Paracoccaceae bacterium]